jgi:hypothetical protein
MLRKKKTAKDNGTYFHVLQMKDALIKAIEDDPTKKYTLKVIKEFNNPAELKLEKERMIKNARKNNPNAFPGNKE